jgi:hypothetical protein
VQTLNLSLKVHSHSEAMDIYLNPLYITSLCLMPNLLLLLSSHS